MGFDAAALVGGLEAWREAFGEKGVAEVADEGVKLQA
jgi:hypothetical protein